MRRAIPHTMPRRKQVQARCTMALRVRNSPLFALGAAGRLRRIAGGQTLKVYSCAKLFSAKKSQKDFETKSQTTRCFFC